MERVDTQKLAVARQLAGIILFVSIIGSIALIFTLGISQPSTHYREVITHVSFSGSADRQPIWGLDPITQSSGWRNPEIHFEGTVIPEVEGSYIDWMYVGLAIALCILGMVNALCLRSALDKLNYPLAIVGSICATLAVLPLGLPLLILIIISRDEFKPVVLS